MDRRVYEVGRSSISIIYGDIRDSRAEVLVSSDDYMLSMSGGVSRALKQAGGAEVTKHARKLTPLEAGGIAVTSAGDLPAKYIFHAVSIGRFRSQAEPVDISTHAAIVRTATFNALELLNRVGCRSIAFPSIGTGFAGIPQDVAATQMASTIIDHLLDAHDALDVELYLMDHLGYRSPMDYFVYFEEFAKGSMALQPSGQVDRRVLEPETAAAHESDRDAEAFTVMRQLDIRRRELEAELVDALSKGERLDTYIDQLRQMEDLRSIYSTASEDHPSAKPDSVFVSSTYEDLKDYRATVRQVIDQLGLRFVGMEEFTAETSPPADLIRQKVTESARYLGILGPRYGFIDEISGLSMTELEYSQAVTSGKPIHMFVMDDSVPVPLSSTERDPKKLEKLGMFRDKVLGSHMCSFFRNAEDLAQRVEATLNPYR